eukprot:664884-Pelagomonas_calceolata.AAC.2
MVPCKTTKMNNIVYDETIVDSPIRRPSSVQQKETRCSSWFTWAAYTSCRRVRAAVGAHLQTPPPLEHEPGPLDGGTPGTRPRNLTYHW